MVIANDILVPKAPDEIQRYVILDASRIMAYGKEMDLDKVCLCRLLAVMRYFIGSDFDVVAVMPQQCSLTSSINIKRVLNKLRKMDLMCMVENNYDDVAVLEIADAADGVVVSNGQFRGHVEFLDRFQNIIDRCVSVEMTKVRDDDIGGYEFLLEQTVPGCSIPSLHDCFFSTMDNIRHEIVEECRQNWTMEYRNWAVDSIDKLYRSVLKNDDKLNG